MLSNITKRLADPAESESDLYRLTDEQVMAEVQEGNGDALGVLFQRYHRLVLVTALKIVRDSSEAQEVTQNIFLEIYRVARRFDPSRGTLKVWLLQYTYHRSINRRKYLLLRHFYNQPDLEEASLWGANVVTANQVPAQELKRFVEQALAKLNEPQRRTIQKVIFEGFTFKEVAEEFDESFSNVRNHYYRGLDRLRTCLAPQSIAVQNERVVPLREVSRGKA